MKVNGRSFHEFCFEVRGYRIYGSNGNEINKYELFHKGINPTKIITKQTKFILKER